MKNTIFAFVLLLNGLLIQAQTSTPSENFDANAPAFKFVEEVIDYGKIEQNADGNREFVFTNTGGSPLIITNVKGSCGCTVPTKPVREPVMPGETGDDQSEICYKQSRTLFKNGDHNIECF